MSTSSLRDQALGLFAKYREFAALSAQLLGLEVRQVVLRLMVLFVVVFVAGWFGVGALVCSIVGVVAYFVFATADIAKGMFIAAGVQVLFLALAAFWATRLARKVDLPLTRRHLQGFSASRVPPSGSAVVQ
jgi:hypothetical protein